MAHRTTLSLLALTTAILPLSAFAAEAPDAAPAPAEAEQSSGDILVTAQRRTSSIQQVPLAVTAIGGEQILDNRIRNPGDVIRVVPNATAPMLEGHIRPRWYIRGIGIGDPTTNVVNPVGVYNDDVYLNVPYLNGFPLFDLERAEVLRGPQGTLWGKNTTAGAVNFISKKPSFDEDTNGYAFGEIGDYGRRALEGAVGAKINDAIAVRIASHFDTSDGFSTNTYNGEKAGKLSDTAIRAQLLFKLNEDWTALVSARYRKYDGYNSAFFAGDGVAKINRDRVAYNAPNDDTLEHQGVSLTLNGKLGALDIVSITAYEDARRTTQYDGDYTAEELNRAYDDSRVNQFSQEIRISSPKDGGPFSWLVGGHYFREKLSSNVIDAALPSEADAQHYQQTAYTLKTDSYALFGSATYDFTDRLSLTAGLRGTWETKSIDLTIRDGGSDVAFTDPVQYWLASSLVDGAAVVGAQKQKKSWSALTFDISPEWKFADNARIFARVARGFRSGNFNGGATTAAEIGVVQPEKLTSYEAGIKSELFGGKLRANANVFYYDYKNIQINVLQFVDGVLLNTLQNAAAGWSKGIELELDGNPTRNLRLGATIGLLDTRYTDFPTISGNKAGNQFARAPHFSGTLLAEYRVPLGDDGAVLLNTDWNYRSRQYLNATRQGTGFAGFEQKAYGVGNVSLSYLTANEKLRFSVFANNVTNAYYKNLVLPGAPGAFPILLGDPRTVGASITARW